MFQEVSEGRIEILAGDMPVKDLLLLIAKLSYETASPRGMGHEQPHQAPSMEVIFEDCITEVAGEPVLLMDYINGRDCRTKVYFHEGKWLFDSYAFQQRKVTSQEFIDGVVRDSAEEFLHKVNEEIARSD